MDAMRRAALIYNPNSGSEYKRREAKLDAAAQELRNAGIAVELVATRGPGTAGDQAKQMLAAGCDMIFACGGDGTIHEVAQGMVESGTKVPLGIVPLGTGNVLAHDLGIPRETTAAVKKQLEFAPTRISVGKVECRPRDGGTLSRYFLIMAGIGVDALIMYRVTAEAKSRFRIFAYLIEGARQAISYRYVPFRFKVNAGESAGMESQGVQVAGVRISSCGPLIGKFAPGAALRRDDIQFIVFEDGNLLKHSQYMTRALLDMHAPIKGIELFHATDVVFEAIPSVDASKVYVEADGEALGMLPARISIVPDALTIFMAQETAKQKG